MNIRIDDFLPVKVDDVINVEHMRRLAKRRLPKAVFDGIDGGALDEMSVRGNREAFADWWIRPRSLVDVNQRDLSTTVLGDTISLPVMLDPCGFSRMCNIDAEVANVRGAGAAGTLYVVPLASTAGMENVRQAATGPTWAQWYPPVSREEQEVELERAKAAGYRVLVVTVDTAVYPIRDRDLRNGLSHPLRMSPGLIVQGAMHPAWSREFLLRRKTRTGVVGGFGAAREFGRTLSRFHPITLDDLVRWKESFGGLVVPKGIMRGEGVREMIDAGIDGVIVSNHGGRNLDGARPTLDILPEVVAAADGRIEVYLDGGIRRGTDVLKALALGARAVLIGRPYLFGLAAYGEPGVRRVLELLRRELDQAMIYAGTPTIADIDANIVVHKSVAPAGVPAGSAQSADEEATALFRAATTS